MGFYRCVSPTKGRQRHHGPALDPEFYLDPHSDHPFDRATLAGWLLAHGGTITPAPSAPAPLIRPARDLLPALPYPPISRKLRAAATTTCHPYRSDHAYQYAVACAAVRTGRPINFVVFTLTDPFTPRTGPTPPTPARIHQLWSDATAFITASNQQRDQVITRLRRDAATQAWDTRPQGSELAVLLAIADLAHKTGRPDTDAAGHPRVLLAVSTEQLAIGSALSIPTARYALRRLLTAGWVTEHTPPTPNTARILQIGPFPDRAAHPQFETLLHATQFVDLSSDATRDGALGKQGALTLAAVTATPGTTADIATMLGVTYNVARIRLWRLHRNGLLTKTGRRWQRSNLPLDEYAAAKGTAGARMRAQQRYRARQRRRQHPPPPVDSKDAPNTGGVP